MRGNLRGCTDKQRCMDILVSVMRVGARMAALGGRPESEINGEVLRGALTSSKSTPAP